MNTVVLSLWLDLAVAVMALLMAACALFMRRRGERGSTGMRGPTGPQGLNGPPGPRGERGAPCDPNEFVDQVSQVVMAELSVFAHDYQLPELLERNGLARHPVSVPRGTQDRCEHCGQVRANTSPPCGCLEWLCRCGTKFLGKVCPNCKGAGK